MMVALFARGHCLFVGVPGLAKTLLVSSCAQALGLKHGRIQFTPDLMPSDITGTEVIEEDRSTGKREFRFIPGPVFANLLLADEINRTPPRTQAALLQAMQEGKVTAGGRTWSLEEPFLVFATQNPIEQEGTWPLPEAQLDRFMFSIQVDYPSEAEEIEMVRRTSGPMGPELEPVVDRELLLALQGMIRRIPVSDELSAQAVRLVRRSRPGPDAPERISRYLQWGAGPRASQFLVAGARAAAALEGRACPDHNDLRAVAPLVLEHRLVRNFQAEAEGVTTRALVEELCTGLIGK
jgi:MoxR-like ATPase